MKNHYSKMLQYNCKQAIKLAAKVDFRFIMQQQFTKLS